jgi:hypothetical protein
MRWHGIRGNFNRMRVVRISRRDVANHNFPVAFDLVFFLFLQFDLVSKDMHLAVHVHEHAPDVNLVTHLELGQRQALVALPD